MESTLAVDFDPLELDVVEKAILEFAETPDADRVSAELDTDEGLEVALHRELAAMVCANGLTDPDGLLDSAIDRSNDSDGRA